LTFIERMARLHGVDVRFEKTDSAEAYVIGRTIVLDPDLYPPRMNWRFCHELAHIQLGHVQSETISREMEYEAERYAAELMLPADKFRPLIGRLDIAGLKERFPHASWEAIAHRWIEFHPAVLTIIDNEKLRLRWAPDGYNYPSRITPPESAVVSECYACRGNVHRECDNLVMSAYFIDEDREVLRVILLTELDSACY